MTARWSAMGCLARRDHRAFSLVELLLALMLALLVGAAVLQTLHASTVFTARLARQLRQQEFALRARRLVESDWRRGDSLAMGYGLPACNLGGRTAVLQLQLEPGWPAVVYSRGSAPSSIWRGEVLMRCGPAFGLDGAQNLSAPWQNRVVLDDLQNHQVLLGWMEELNRLSQPPA